MHTRPSIQAIAFDAYGTLFNVGAVDERLRDFFGAQAGAVAARWRAHQVELTWLRTLMGRYQAFSVLTREALRMACRQENLILSRQQADELMHAYFHLELFPDVAGGVRDLHLHMPLAILTNAEPELVLPALAHTGLRERFSAILSADSIRQFKPSAEVYRLGTAHFRCEPAALLFVSGNTWDVAGAVSAGLTTCWVRRDPGAALQESYKPRLIVDSLADLPEHLSQLR
jgi:2-haloacid dehalogenase